MDRFERQVDPDGILSPQERARRAQSARAAYFSRLALRSARVRRLKKLAAEEEARIEAATVDDPERFGHLDEVPEAAPEPIQAGPGVDAA